MKKERIVINNIPSIIWGEKSSKVFIAIHGSMSNKEDTVIEILANNVTAKGYQVLSFDLPEHGERKNDTTVLCQVQNCVSELTRVIEYAKNNYTEINIFACSMGAYFSLLAYKNEKINMSMFLSPIVNMEKLIQNMMLWSNTTEKELEERKEIKTDFGQVLFWDYYVYVKENPIEKWNANTYILYGTKDNMQDIEMIREFSNKYNCNMTIYEEGEHFFHTKEQLEEYERWLENIK